MKVSRQKAIDNNILLTKNDLDDSEMSEGERREAESHLVKARQAHSSGDLDTAFAHLCKARQALQGTPRNYEKLIRFYDKGLIEKTSRAGQTGSEPARRDD